MAFTSRPICSEIEVSLYMLLFSGNNIKPCTHWNLPVSPPLHPHGTCLPLKRVIWDDELEHDFTTTATIINSLWSRPKCHVMRGFFRFLFKCRVCSWALRWKEKRRLTFSFKSVWDYDSTGLWILCVYDGKRIKISESNCKFKLCFTPHAHCLSEKDCNHMVCFFVDMSVGYSYLFPVAVYWTRWTSCLAWTCCTATFVNYWVILRPARV